MLYIDVLRKAQNLLKKLFKKKPHKTRDGKVVLTLKAHNIDTFIDVGANNGQTHDYLREQGFTGQIISVEPLPSLQQGLQERATKDPLWKVLPPLALGDKEGMIDINLSEASDMSSLMPATDTLLKALPRTRSTGVATIPMKTLDMLYSELKLAGKKVYIKLDTQGYEMKILRHADAALAQATGVQVEMSLFELYKGEALYDEIIGFLKARGFSPHLLLETTFSRRINRQLQIDGVFFKE